MRSNLRLLVAQREMKEARRIPNEEIERETGIDRATLSRWLDPSVRFERISATVAARLCKWAGCKLDDLLSLEAA